MNTLQGRSPSTSQSAEPHASPHSHFHVDGPCIYILALNGSHHNNAVPFTQVGMAGFHGDYRPR